MREWREAKTPVGLAMFISEPLMVWEVRDPRCYERMRWAAYINGKPVGIKNGAALRLFRTADAAKAAAEQALN